MAFRYLRVSAAPLRRQLSEDRAAHFADIARQAQEAYERNDARSLYRLQKRLQPYKPRRLPFEMLRNGK
eukprot:5059202-Alexandrium_andersonii.AAC.1